MIFARSASCARLTPILLVLLALVGCQPTPVISHGTVVTDQTITTAAQAVRIAELAVVTVADTLTAEYKAGRINAEILQTFQGQVAPKIAAALATAKLALQTFQDAPERPSGETVLRSAVFALQGELVTLQGYWLAHVPIAQRGARP